MMDGFANICMQIYIAVGKEEKKRRLINDY